MAIAFSGAGRYNEVLQSAGRDLEARKTRKYGAAWSHRVIAGGLVSQRSGIDWIAHAIGAGDAKPPETSLD